MTASKEDKRMVTKTIFKYDETDRLIEETWKVDGATTKSTYKCWNYDNSGNWLFKIKTFSQVIGDPQQDKSSKSIIEREIEYY